MAKFVNEHEKPANGLINSSRIEASESAINLRKLLRQLLGTGKMSTNSKELNSKNEEQNFADQQNAASQTV